MPQRIHMHMHILLLCMPNACAQLSAHKETWSKKYAAPELTLRCTGEALRLTTDSFFSLETAEVLHEEAVA